MNKNLHHRIGPAIFHLRLHRTGVVRDPLALDDLPVFPLLRKYMQCNYTLEGLERKLSPDDPTELGSCQDLFPPKDDNYEGKSEPHALEMPAFKYTIDGKRIPIDPSRKWLRRTTNWVPHEVPTEMWQK